MARDNRSVKHLFERLRQEREEKSTEERIADSAFILLMVMLTATLFAVLTIVLTGLGASVPVAAGIVLGVWLLAWVASRWYP